MNSTDVLPKESNCKKKSVGFLCVKEKSDKLSFLPLKMKFLKINVCGKPINTQTLKHTRQCASKKKRE